jgi:hypothetical protein
MFFYFPTMDVMWSLPWKHHLFFLLPVYTNMTWSMLMWNSNLFFVILYRYR